MAVHPRFSGVTPGGSRSAPALAPAASITSTGRPTAPTPIAAAPMDPEPSPTRIALENAEKKVNDPEYDYDLARWT